MTIFKCLNNLYISTTQEILRKINAWKKTRVNLAKVFNHIAFIRRSLKEGVTPMGFRRTINANVKSVISTQRKVGIVIMKDTLEELFRKQIRLMQEENGLRVILKEKIQGDCWAIMDEKVTEGEKAVFLEQRKNQMEKMNKLLESKDKTDSSQNRGTLINISSAVLSTHQKSVLSRGLRFIPTDNRVDLLRISVDVEQALIRANIRDDTLPKKFREIFKNKVNEPDNLSKHERLALEELRRNEDIVIALSDKGNVTLVIDKIDYEEKLEEKIMSEDYKQLKKDPALKIDRDIRKVAAAVKKSSKDKKIFYKLVSHYTRHPGIFGNLKIHKVGSPIRLIVTNFNTVTENAANFIKGILNHYVENYENSSITTGIAELKTEMNRIELHTNEDYVIASIDIVNMFGSVNIEKALNIIQEIIVADTMFEEKFDISTTHFLSITNIVLQNSYFSYKDNFYKQVKGIPMGSGISPAVADLVLLKLEDSMKGMDSFKSVTFYRRYRDDGIIIWKGNRGGLGEFVEDINELDESLKFTLEVEKEGKLPFLDAWIIRDDSKLKFRTYEKPYSSGQILDYNSYHDIKVKNNIIAGETVRYCRITDNMEEDLDRLKEKLMNNNFPKRVVEEGIHAAKRNLETGKVGKKERTGEKFITLDYPGKKKSKDIKKILKPFDLKVSFRKRKNLGGVFSRSYKSNTNLGKGLVYSVLCNCGEEYVGETGKSLNTRMDQHSYAVKTIDMTNGIAAHTQSCSAGINWNTKRILGYEGDWFKRKIAEGLWIQKNKPSMNLKLGFQTRGNWN